MRGTRLWMVLTLIGLLAAGIVAAGCGDDEEEGSTTGEARTAEPRARSRRGKLLVGADTPYPPFEIGQPPDITGYDIEVMNEVAEDLGLEVDLPGHVVRHDLPRRGPGQVRHGRRGDDDPAGARADGRLLGSLLRDGPIALVVPEGSDIASVDDVAGQIVATQDATTPSSTPTTRPTPPRCAGSRRVPTRSTLSATARPTPASSTSRSPWTRSRRRAASRSPRRSRPSELFGFGFGARQRRAARGVQRVAAEAEGRRHDRRALREVLPKDSRPRRRCWTGTNEPT